MSTALTVIVAFLAVIFVISGLSKASGNEKGLSGTREVNVPDMLARTVGFFETLSGTWSNHQHEVELDALLPTCRPLGLYGGCGLRALQGK
jgi:hypothetical protein